MKHLFTLALALALVACQGEKDEVAHTHHAQEGEPLPLPKLAADARVFFVSPADGAVVKGPLVDDKVEVKVEMGAKGTLVEPAGEVKDGSGHHHVLVDVEGVAAGLAVPADERHIHFGKGQTEAVIPLSPGKHRLSLQFADGAHRSYGPAMTHAITVTVEAEEEAEAPAEAPAPEASDEGRETDGD